MWGGRQKPAQSEMRAVRMGHVFYHAKRDGVNFPQTVPVLVVDFCHHSSAPKLKLPVRARRFEWGCFFHHLRPLAPRRVVWYEDSGSGGCGDENVGYPYQTY